MEKRSQEEKFKTAVDIKKKRIQEKAAGRREEEPVVKLGQCTWKCTVCNIFHTVR